MVQYVITPWRNRQELLQVRAQLYPTVSGTEDGRRSIQEGRTNAVAKVAVWVQRGNCPHLVESTSILTSAMLNDVPGNSTYCVRAAYSAAFCRFVTGILDSHQDKRRKMSMYAIAKTIGLPATYVELRHQATHEELPSLSKLRAGTQKALRWIWEYYWVHLNEQKQEPEEDECKALVYKFATEKDERVQRKLEAALGKWDGDRVLEALVEAQSSTRNPGTLMRLVKLQENIMSGDDGVMVEEVQNDGSRSSSLDEVRAEMASMQKHLLSPEQRPAPRKRQKKDAAAPNDTPKGWAMFEGVWTPKPIGVL